MPIEGSTHQAQPSTWIGLIERWQGQGLQDLTTSTTFHEPRLIAASRAEAVYSLPRLFPGVGTLVSRVAALHGASACRPALRVWVRFLPQTVEQLDAQLAQDVRRSSGIIYVLAVIDAARCCGVLKPAEYEDVERRWLAYLAPNQKRLLKGQRISAACAYLAAGQPDFAAAWIGGGALRRHQPSGKNYADAQGAIRYLAAGLAAGMPEEAILPAWRELVARFPVLLSSEQLGWQDLLWCAHTVVVRFQHQPVHTVADALHTLVLQLCDGSVMSQ